MIGGGFGGGGGGGPRSMLRSFGEERTTKAFDRHVMRRLFRLLLPHMGKMLAGLVCMLAAAGAQLVAPILIAEAIDVYIPAADTRGLSFVGMLLVGVYIARYVAQSLQRYTLGWVGHKVLAEMRARLFAHLQRIDMGYHDTHITGVTISRVINDVQTINELLSQGLVTLVGDVALLVGIIIVMLGMSAELALLTFTIIPLMVLATVVFSRYARAAFQETRQTVAEVVGDLAEGIQGMRVIQAYNQEKRSRRRFREHNRANRDSHIRAMSMSFVFMPTVEFLSIAAIAIVLWFGGRFVIEGVVSLGVMVAFLNYVSRFFQPIRELSQIYSTMQKAMAGGEQLFRLLDTEPAIQDGADAIELSEIEGHIEFDQVRLRYTRETEVLHGVSLTVEPGEMIALVGPTGAGKTSIARLIPRLYEATEGAVLIDGHDVRDITQHSLRQHMALVSQDPFLFSGTLRENISFGDPQMSDARIVDAARRARADEFISRLSDGYDTHIQEGAVNLSLGQRQLVSIARAIARDPRILIMDEATSNVDTMTEERIQDALEELFSGRTSVVIAHRLSTIQRADTIHVVEHGQIAESGTHAELLEAGGLYAELCSRQFVSREVLESPASLGSRSDRSTNASAGKSERRR